jgi:glutamine amidotransferase
MTATRIGIIDAGAANLASVESAVLRAGGTPQRIAGARQFAGVNGIIFPGVANVGFVLDELQRRGLREPLRDWLDRDAPFLGICAGFQAMFESSEEAPGSRGFGVFSARVQRLRGPKRIHMGWNHVTDVDRPYDEAWAYFAHGFAPPPDFAGVTMLTTFGSPFASMARRGNATGVQFHPERSAAFGAAVLSDFLAVASRA